MKESERPKRCAKRDEFPRMWGIKAILRKHPLARKKFWSVLKEVSLPPRPRDGYSQKGW